MHSSLQHTQRHHTLHSLGALYDADDAEALAEWCEWNDTNGNYREADGTTLWHIGEYWDVIVDAYDR